MKIIIPFTQKSKRFQRIKKHMLTIQDTRKRLESDALEYCRCWQYGFYTPKCLNILRENYKRFYKN